jgi:hypothetical protein
MDIREAPAEDNGEILACLGFWDWSRISQIRVRSISPNVKPLHEGVSLGESRIFIDGIDL